jgi:predicted Zn-dependent peptidase
MKIFLRYACLLTIIKKVIFFMEDIMYKRNILNNGIKIVSEYIPYVNSISIGIWVKSGSRYENADNNGISHFI